MNTTHLIIVVPCYNEESVLPARSKYERDRCGRKDTERASDIK